MESSLTEDEKSYLQRLFWDHNQKIDAKLHEELTLLSKYKGDLARNYVQVGSYQNILIGCMKDTINKQEEIMWLFRDLVKVITGKYPKAIGRVEAEEIDRIPIEDLFKCDERPIWSGMINRIIKALKEQGIQKLDQLSTMNVNDLATIPNLGERSVATIIYFAEKKGIEILFCGKSFSRIREFLKECRDGE